MIYLRKTWSQFTRDFGQALISIECHLTELTRKRFSDIYCPDLRLLTTPLPLDLLKLRQ